jgi:hypothetical protein
LKLEVPAVVGMPLITSVDEFSANPDSFGTSQRFPELGHGCRDRALSPHSGITGE